MKPFILPDIPIADGTPLSLGHVSLGTRALAVATDEDWSAALERARHRISSAGGAISEGMTWEEGLAAWAAVLLRRSGGNGKPAMGRTPDEGAWELQRKRWVALTFECAAKGSTSVEQGYQRRGTEEFLTRPEAEAVLANGVVDLVPVWRDSQRVLSSTGMIALAEVARSPLSKEVEATMATLRAEQTKRANAEGEAKAVKRAARKKKRAQP